MNTLLEQARNRTFTPQSLAWSLLLGNAEEIRNGGLSVESDLNQQVAVFETLLQIYMEMIMNSEKLNFYNEYPDKTFTFDKTLIKFNNDFIIEKFSLTGYDAYIEVIDKTDDYEYASELFDKRYARIVFNHTTEPFYEIKLNGNYKPTPFKDMFCAILINNNIIKISFKKQI